MRHSQHGTGLVEELIGALEDTLGDRELKADKVAIGVFYTAVELNTGHTGIAFTPVREIPEAVCCPRSASRMPAAGHLAGASAWDLLNYARSDGPLKISVGIAALNALSALAMEAESGHYQILRGADALDVAQARSDDRVALVGAFVPFIKKLNGQVSNLVVLEKNPQALKADEMYLYRPAEEAPDVLPKADVVIISGSAIVHRTLEYLLSLCTSAREVVVAGPTASMRPEPLFSRGVTVLGGISINDGDEMVRLVAEGGSGYFFGGCAEKVVVVPGFHPGLVPQQGRGYHTIDSEGRGAHGD
jgi:uncharacterized protein (DUF4213/DUF364 family)